MVQLSCNWSSTYVLFGPPSMYVCVWKGGGDQSLDEHNHMYYYEVNDLFFNQKGIILSEICV